MFQQAMMCMCGTQLSNGCGRKNQLRGHACGRGGDSFTENIEFLQKVWAENQHILVQAGTKVSHGDGGLGSYGSIGRPTAALCPSFSSQGKDRLVARAVVFCSLRDAFQAKGQQSHEASRLPLPRRTGAPF